MSPTGHLAIGFAAKKHAPQIPIVIFLIAAYAIDLIYFIFLALGMDQFDYNPWSHSLFMATVWSVSAAMIAKIVYKSLKSSILFGLVVFSHWMLDFIVWGNLPIYFEKAHRVGLGLYDRIGFNLTPMTLNSGAIIATSIELSMLIIGLVVYVVFLKKSRKDKLNLPS